MADVGWWTNVGRRIKGGGRPRVADRVADPGAELGWRTEWLIQGQN